MQATNVSDRIDNKIPHQFNRDKYLLRQKNLTVSEKYRVADEWGRDLLFVDRPCHFFRSIPSVLLGIAAGALAFFIIKGTIDPDSTLNNNETVLSLAISGGLIALTMVSAWLRPRRHISFYGDETKEELLLEIEQEKKFVIINDYYSVFSPDGQLLARLRKNNLFSFLRMRWYVYSTDGSLLAMAKQDSIIMKILNPFYILNFIIFEQDTGKVLGEFNREFTLFERYVLDLSYDRMRLLDRRIALALGVMLDTGQRR